MSISRGCKAGRDVRFAAMVALTVALVTAVLFANSRNALRPELGSGPRIDVKKVEKRIGEAGLEPRDAMYFRVIP